MSFSVTTAATDDRDFQIGIDGRLTLSVGGGATVDRLRTRLGTWRGDWYLDTQRGIDYKNKILGRSRNGGEVSAILRREILSEPEVAQIVAFTLSQDNNDRRGFVAEVRVVLSDSTTSLAVTL